MARRGRCRCGSLLTFTPSPQGYKTRCPDCGAVVRLRDDVPQGAEDPPIAVLPAEEKPGDGGMLAMVDTTPYYGPLAQNDPPAYEDPKSMRAGWWWLGGAALLIVLAVGAAVAWASWQGGGSHGASGG